MGNCCISNKVDIEQNEIKLRESQINLEKHTVLNLLSDESLLGELSKNALVSVENKWSQNRTAEILLGLINENVFYE